MTDVPQQRMIRGYHAVAASFRMAGLMAEAPPSPAVPELADEMDGAIDEGSQLHQVNGYYAQGVGPDTATLPKDWLPRVYRVQNGNTGDRVGYCMDLRDLFLAKAAAGREKDREFCMALFEHGYVTPAALLELVPTMPMDDREQRTLRATVRRCANAVRDSGHDVPMSGAD